MRFTMLFFQDDKDKLKQELKTINRKLDELKGMQAKVTVVGTPQVPWFPT